MPYKAPLLISYSDASKVGYGAFVVGTNEVTHCMWSTQEIAESSIWRKLKAIQFSLNSFKALVRGKCIKWHSDNRRAVRIMDTGSPNAKLHLIFSIFVKLTMLHLCLNGFPRELNVCADAISDIVDFDDWYTTL